MGLLSDPHSEKGKLVTLICKLHAPITMLMYIGAIVWLCLLPYSKISMNISFSENALLPGLVKTEFSHESIAKDYYHELLDEMKTYKDTIPYPWLTAKMRQIGLDTFVHNFTLNYPLGKGQTFTGNNVYGILRAPRAASTEALIISVPFRPPNNANPTTAPSIAIMLAFAKFAIKEKYWAKDIIFLVTEHEQLGVQAWLQAYHGTGLDKYGILNYGDLEGRAGQIGAAVNLEINDIKISVMDIKIEGLNGQLPNLDIFTLVNKICMKEGLFVTFKNRVAIKNWKYSLTTMFHMILTQSTGIPNGNHGLFLRYGIQSVTLNGFLRLGASKRENGNQIGFFSMGKILEGIVRSLNNLLEKFHQSYFFYLLPSNDRFVSIIYFIPILGALVGALLVKSLVNWYSITEKPQTIFKNGEISISEINAPNLQKSDKSKSAYTYDIAKIFTILIVSHTIGLFLMYSGPIFTKLGTLNNLSTDYSLFYAFTLTSFSVIFLARTFTLTFKKSILTLNMLILWEIALTILGIGMINISLGIIAGLIFVPTSLFVSCVTKSKFRSRLNFIVWFLANPISVLINVVFFYTYFTFPKVGFKELCSRSFSATRQALVFAYVDSEIYGNWIFDVSCLIFFPSWVAMCCVILSCPFTDQENIIKEKVKKEQ